MRNKLTPFVMGTIFLVMMMTMMMMIMIMMMIKLIFSFIYIQWSLRIKDTLGPI